MMGKLHVTMQQMLNGTITVRIKDDMGKLDLTMKADDVVLERLPKEEVKR
jgi:hypothetical protein